MSAESRFLDLIRPLAGNAAARGLRDDVAVLEFGGARLVLTHDMMVEGVHFLAKDPPADVAWKLVAVNLSDLAAKGARPAGVLLGYTLTDDGWNAEFARGLAEALAAFDLPLLGGDTVSIPGGSARSLGLTAIGEAGATVPDRSGARPGDRLWVSGTIGDAGIGLAIAQGKAIGPAFLLGRYRRPEPRLAAGRALAPLVSAMMDVSDGLLIDAERIAAASEVAIALDLDRVPLSSALVQMGGADRRARLAAATAGDDYELLFTAPPAASQRIDALATELDLALTCIGSVNAGAGLHLHDRDGTLPLPATLGWEHDPAPAPRA